MSAHAALKAMTRDAHHRLDAGMTRHDLTDRAGYAAFLTIQAAALPAIEQGLTDAGAARFLPDWNVNRRAASLLADLAALNIAPPPTVDPPHFADDAELLGGLYVIEGSRLGAAMLKRLAGTTFPVRFLGSPQPKGQWRQFVAGLDKLLYASADQDRAGRAALATFGRFEEAMRVSVDE